MEDEEEGKEYEVEDIESDIEINGQTLYHVRWKGFGPENDSYEPIDNLGNCQEILIRYFEKKENQKKLKNANRKAKSSSPYKSKPVVKKKEQEKIKKDKPVKDKDKKSTKNLGSYFSSDIEDIFDISSDSKKSDKKKKSKNVKSAKDTPKKKKESSSSRPIKSEIFDSDSGDIFSDLSPIQPQQEETIIIEERNKEKGKKAKEKEKEKTKDKKKKEKDTSKPNQEKSSKTVKDSPRTKKSVSKSNKKSSKNEDISKSPKTKSDSKRRSSAKESAELEKKYILPFDLFLSDDNEIDKKDSDTKPKYNIYARYSEEHQLVLNPYPIKAMKCVTEEKGVKHIECEIPDRIEPELIPVSLLRILQPKMLEKFDENQH